jgi:hypothetical protein
LLSHCFSVEKAEAAVAEVDWVLLLCFGVAALEAGAVDPATPITTVLAVDSVEVALVGEVLQEAGKFLSLY